MQLPDNLKEVFQSKARTDAGFAIAAAIADLADAQRDVAARLQNIGRLDLIVDHHAKAVKEIAGAMSDVYTGANIIGGAIQELAEAVDRKQKPKPQPEREAD